MTDTKFTKAEMQKLVLSGIGFVVVIYVYFSFFLGPLNRSRETMERKIDDLQRKIASSKGDMQKAANLERAAVDATSRFESYKAASPEGAPIAWFPPRVKAFFASQHVERANAKLDGNTAYTEPELSEWTRYIWSVDLPETEFATVGSAIAEWENTEPLLSVTKIALKASADNPQFQQVTLTANTTILKR